MSISFGIVVWIIYLQETSVKVVTVIPSISSSRKIEQISRRYAFFSASIHSRQRAYIFFAPITAAAWQRIGYKTVFVFTGDFKQNLNKDHQAQLNLSRQLLTNFNVEIIDFQCPEAYAVKMSQIVRLYSGFVSEKIIDDTDLVLTTDSDLIPMKIDDYNLSNNDDGFIYNAFCCGEFQRHNQSYPMYPISHLCFKKRMWRELMLQEFSNPNHKNISLSFEMVSEQMRTEFGSMFDSTMVKGDPTWYMDQIFISMSIENYLQHQSTVHIDRRHKKSIRLDPHLSQQAWDKYGMRRYGDAHLMHDQIFESYHWAGFRNLLNHLFNSTLINQFELYYKQFIHTVHESPDQQINESI